MPSFSKSLGIALILTGLCSGVPTELLAQQHFTDCLQGNVNDATVILSQDATIQLANRDTLSTGDEIALFSNDGRCAGVAVWDSSKAAVSLTVADRDTTAEISEGYEDGESLKFRVWRQSDGREFEIASTSYACSLSGCRSDGVYQPDAVYEVSKLSVAESALPVEMAAFEAARSGREIVLTWQTASETNNSGFRVQHKTGKDASWSTLSFVEGAGTSSSPNDYQYTVEDLPYGQHNFRLAQIDQDGSKNTTSVVGVELSLEKAYAISTVYPNPVRQTGALDLTVRDPQKVTVRLYDVLGRQLRILFDQRLSPNRTRTLRLQTGSIPSGQYFLRIRGENFKATRRLTIVK